MDYKQTRDYLLSRPEAIEDFPFGTDVAVFKVMGKMFATLSHEAPNVAKGGPNMNLKCDPDEANALRDVFDAVIPAYHMNKMHWNTVILNNSIPKNEIERMIDRSYGLVVKGLRKKTREALELRYSDAELYR